MDTRKTPFTVERARSLKKSDRTSNSLSCVDPHLPIGIYALPEISAIGPPEHELTQRKIPYETGILQYVVPAQGGEKETLPSRIL